MDRLIIENWKLKVENDLQLHINKKAVAMAAFLFYTIPLEAFLMFGETSDKNRD